MDAILALPDVRARMRRWTVAEYTALTEDNPAFRGFELIRGYIVAKMPKGPLHTSLTDFACENLRRTVRAGLIVRQEAALQLKDSSPEPDVAVVRGTRNDFWRCHPTTAELVVEIAVSSVALDRENASLYAEAGIAQYWIVLAEREEIEAYSRPENGVYQEKRTYRRGEIIPCVCVEDGTVPVETWFL